jgi:dimethylhistidine N-methyltransferase
MQIQVDVLDEDSPFAADVRKGLLQSPKRLSCTWLYDEIGSRLFEEICALPEYYLTRAEREILAVRARELALMLPGETAMIELGSGSSAKTRLLIEAFLARHPRLVYLPIDVSRAMLVESCRALAAQWPGLEVEPIVADYQRGLERAFSSEPARPKLLMWLGSSIGNLSPAEAVTFLSRLRERAVAHDRLLLGIDLRKDRMTLERAYDDARGVTACFNLNLLARINRELGGRFDLQRFRHMARWDAGSGCVSMHLVARGAQRVAIERIGLQVDFSDGESIHTESSFKYDLDAIERLAVDSGFAVERRWLDRGQRFSVHLFRPSTH